MKNKGCFLSWIVVSDLKKSVKFFTEVLGMKLGAMQEQWHWAEVYGEGGARLGIAGAGPHSPLKPGDNAVATFTVDNLASAIEEAKQKGVKLIGEVQEVPGQVKLQLIADQDGNLFQLVEELKK